MRGAAAPTLRLAGVAAVFTVGRKAVFAIEKFAAAAQHCCVPFTPDPIDHHLLGLLQQDAGRTLRELGDQVGLSPSAVQRRIRAYHRAGVITGQIAVLDAAALGATALAAVLVTLERESAEHHARFRARMLAEPRVQQCYDLAGQWDYLVMLITENLGACRALSDRLFTDDANVRRYDTLPVLDPVKVGLSIPLPGPNAEPGTEPGTGSAPGR